MHPILSFKMPLSSIILINIDFFSPVFLCIYKMILLIIPYCKHDIVNKFFIIAILGC